MGSGCCTPTCTAPSTRACGDRPSNGCGGLCGVQETENGCTSVFPHCNDDGLCEAAPPECTADCDGKTCYDDDGCDALCVLTTPCQDGEICVSPADLTDYGVEAELDVVPSVLAPNGYLHAATVVALADTACGFGCRLSLPSGATGFTTIEQKTSYLGTARDGVVRTVATAAHRGRQTQVWDADVYDDSGRRIALFRCTQLILRNDEMLAR